MKVRVVALLIGVLTTLLTVAVLIGYRNDQQVIRWFPGTGTAGKVDVFGAEPAYLSIEDDMTGAAATVGVQADGSFIAPLDPGTYRLRLADDSRSVTVVVPDGQCIDLVLDFRTPLIVLKIPGEGWPIPG
jgi:hypothetical protein